MYFSSSHFIMDEEGVHFKLILNYLIYKWLSIFLGDLNSILFYSSFTATAAN